MKKEINRREFMKVTAHGIAASGWAGLIPIANMPASAKNLSQKGISAEWIASLVKNHVLKSPNNSLRNTENEKAWDEPLVGFSRGDDPIYQFFKEDIGPFYWTPLEIFNLVFPEITVKPEELSVISWVLPHTESIKSDLRKKEKRPSEKWIRARLYGGEFIEELGRYVADTLTESGYPAFSPTLTKAFNPMATESKRYGLATSWSERHAAYASGLGTFGLCDGLITPVGKAIRCGSVVARIKLPPSPRPYKDHHAYCLYYAKGSCGMCISRCPAGAITKSGHDKKACANQCMSTWEYATRELGFPPKAYGCGFCQTGVPCESRVPVKI